MMKMKKIISVLIVLTGILTLFASCGNTSNTNADNKITIITTIFPEYDWVMNLIKGIDNIEVTMLLDNGVDLHSYQPSATDLINISSSDMFIYIGGNSDLWVTDALNSTETSATVAVNLMEVLKDSIKEEELVSGMQAEDEEETGDDIEYDEHIWLSIRNAEKICSYITDKLILLDNANEAAYEANRNEYLSKLDELDKKYEAAVFDANRNTILVADRFPFRYLTDDYNIEYFAAFAGCNTESSASFETISFLAKKADELNLKYILTLENSKTNIAQTVCDTSTVKPEILTLNSMQSSTSADYENGESYLSIMENNLEVLKTVLS